MSVNIFYNNTDFFSQNNLATPEVSRSTTSIVFGDKVGVKENLQLTGQIHLENSPTDCDYFSELNTLRDSLLNFFSVDFKSIEIKENSTSIFQRDFCKILNVDFGDSDYVKIIPYSISIECYDESIHNEFFGISSPTNETSISLSENGIYTIKRNISATGENLQDGNLISKNTSSISSGLDNAIDFVKSFSGETNVVLPTEDPDIKINLISTSESIDRIKNSFTLEEVYIADKDNTGLNQGVLRYTISKEKSFNSVVVATINGNLRFGKNSSFSEVRNRFKEIDFHQEIQQKLNITNLIKYPLSASITENEESKSIDFNLSFDDDDNFDSCGISKKINHSIIESGGMVEISTSGTIEARGLAGKRWELVSDAFYNTSYNSSLYSSWINEEAQNEISKTFPGTTLYTYPELENITENKRAGIIRFEYQYTNREKIENFRDFSLNSQVKLPSPRYSVDQNFGGAMNKFVVTRSGFNSGLISVSVSGVYENFTGNESSDRETAINLLKNKAEEKFNELSGDIFLGYSSVTSSKNTNYSKNSNRAVYAEVRNYYEL
jgi:hypothetical protein